MFPGRRAGDYRTPELSPDDTGLVRELIRRETGVELASQDYLIKQRLTTVARRLALDDAQHVVRELRLGGRHKLEISVVDAMTTNVTSFFRDPRVFGCLAGHVFPELVRLTTQERRPLVIWSAACSSGQEPVSLAILLHERFPQLLAPGRCQIVATDVSPAMVERAAAGVYTGREIGHGLSDTRIAANFDRQGDHWLVKPHLRALIQARTLNLLRSYAEVPRADLVLVRNVLIYFSPENRAAVLEKMRHEVLAAGGSLLLGGSESGLFAMTNVGFRSERLPGGTRYLPI